ncbi:MAG: DNA-3-methyladenine glycosylase [Microbacterium sp.]|nr:DNA-3-methyladenine glycosylase [Microbacterium sp.]
MLAGSAVEVAPRLLGATLTVTDAHGTVAVRLTEVEAYLGEDDPGSHAFRGRTNRNAVMYGPAGRLYVYFTYGMHHCVNVVCGGEGEPAAVLLRGGEVVDGVELARARRPTARTDTELARGPARLCSALGLTLADNGLPLTPVERRRLAVSARARTARRLHSSLATDAPARVATLALGPVPEGRVLQTRRTGVGGAGGGPDHPWRFAIAGDPTVSPYRAHTPKRR